MRQNLPEQNLCPHMSASILVWVVYECMHHRILEYLCA